MREMPVLDILNGHDPGRLAIACGRQIRISCCWNNLKIIIYWPGPWQYSARYPSGRRSFTIITNPYWQNYPGG